MINFYKKSKIIYIFALLAFTLSVPSTYLEAQSADKPKTQTKYKCIDLDENIENKYGQIETIFEEKGETFFREIEEKEFFANQNKFDLISLGGGVIENDNIFENLLKSHRTIYLSLNFESLWERIKNSNRPLVSNGREVLESRYKNRIKRYEMMEYKISNENVKDTTSKVLEIMETQNA